MKNETALQCPFPRLSYANRSWRTLPIALVAVVAAVSIPHVEAAVIIFPGDLGLVNFAGGGKIGFKFTVVGKNPNSTGTALAFDAIDLIPQ